MPSSQKSDVRPISFVLWDKPANARPVEVRLAIRPEDMKVTYPSRMVVQQTLGDPWVDGGGDGKGITRITLAGHTGWREGVRGTDGIGRFQELRDTVYTQWHDRRKAAINAGINPDGVELIYSDALDSITAIVLPQTFVLQRSKSRPLLCQFNIDMLVLSDKLDSYLPKDKLAGGNLGDIEGFGLDSLIDSINSITSFVNGINDFIQTTIVGPIKAFVQKTVNLLNAVKNMVGAITNVFDSVIQIARLVTQAGANIFRSLAMVVNLPSTIKQKFMEVGSAFSNAFCVLSNSLRRRRYYQDYSAILGASNCSSTSGGAPLSQFRSTNTFAAVAPLPEVSPVAVTSQGMAGLRSLATADLVSRPMSSKDLEDTVIAANDGLTVAAA